MHRSGTSAFTRVSSLLGARLPSDLMPALDSVNPTGFWESEAVASLDDEILATVGRTWDDVRPIAPSRFDSPAVHALRKRAVELLREESSGGSLLALKDPRLCRTLPLWIAALADSGATAVFLHVVRNPLEIAESIRARDGFGQAQSLLLWLRHVLEAERTTRSQRRTFATYAALLEDWRRVMTKVSKELRLRWPRGHLDAAAEVEAFLEPSRRHHSFDAADLARPEIPPLVRDVHAALLDAATGDSASVGERLDACSERLRQAEALYAGLLEPEGERFQALELSRAEVARLESVLATSQQQLQGTLAEQERQLASSREEVAALEARGVEITARAERAERNARELSADLSACRAETSRLHEVDGAREAELRGLNELVGARDAEIQLLERRVATRDFELRRLERRVQALSQKVAHAEATHRADFAAILGALHAGTG